MTMFLAVFVRRPCHHLLACGQNHLRAAEKAAVSRAMPVIHRPGPMNREPVELCMAAMIRGVCNKHRQQQHTCHVCLGNKQQGGRRGEQSSAAFSAGAKVGQMYASEAKSSTALDGRGACVCVPGWDWVQAGKSRQIEMFGCVCFFGFSWFFPFFCDSESLCRLHSVRVGCTYHTLSRHPPIEYS